MVEGIDASSRYKAMLNYFRGFLPLRSVPLSTASAAARSDVKLPPGNVAPYGDILRVSKVRSESPGCAQVLDRWQLEKRVVHNAMVA